MSTGSLGKLVLHWCCTVALVLHKDKEEKRQEEGSTKGTK